MKPKLIVLFTLIVLIPCALLFWIGLSGVHNEREIVERNISEILQGELKEIASRIVHVVTEYKRRLIRSTDSLPLERFEIQGWIRREPLCSHVFILDARGELIYPAPSQELSDRERDFLKRTEHILSDKQLFFSREIFDNLGPIRGANDPAPEQQIIQKPSRQQAVPKQPIQQVRQQGFQQQAEPFQLEAARTFLPQVTSASGWHAWFWGNGMQLLFWQRFSDGRVAGVELNRSRFIADVIAALPDASSQKRLQRGGLSRSVSPGSHGRKQLIRLLDSTGDVLYQWGGYEADEDETRAAVYQLPDPLGAWHFEYFAADSGLYGELARSRYINLIAVLAAVGLILGFLVFYFYRESSRELREAGQRVTFVNRVSHELKTPLTNVRMYGELLQREVDETNATAERYLDVILSESRRLSRLIGNILSFARKQRNRLQLHKIRGDLNETVKTVISHFKPALEEKGVGITFHAGAAEEVAFDRDVLEQILGNLFNNVEKYAHAGEQMVVAVTVEKQQAAITVRDYGPGIPDSQKEKIFLPFHRISNRLTDGVSGTGIGLSIARDLARLHGGDLQLKTVEKGACFEATLQIEE